MHTRGREHSVGVVEDVYIIGICSEIRGGVPIVVALTVKFLSSEKTVALAKWFCSQLSIFLVLCSFFFALFGFQGLNLGYGPWLDLQISPYDVWPCHVRHFKSSTQVANTLAWVLVDYGCDPAIMTSVWTDRSWIPLWEMGEAHGLFMDSFGHPYSGIRHIKGLVDLCGCWMAGCSPHYIMFCAILPHSPISKRVKAREALAYVMYATIWSSHQTSQEGPVFPFCENVEKMNISPLKLCVGNKQVSQEEDTETRISVMSNVGLCAKSRLQNFLFDVVHKDFIWLIPPLNVDMGTNWSFLC